MRIGIVTDSTSDLPPYLVQEHGIEVVPLMLIIDGKQYEDGVGLSRAELYERLPQLQGIATTAAPGIGPIQERYRRLFDQGCEHVLSIHAAGALTSILATAEQAARDFEDRVTVVDSRSLSLGLGFQVLAAAEAAEHGLGAVLSAAESTRRRLRVLAALDTLRYVRRSGRLPAAVSTFGGVLHLKPIIELSEGEIRIVSAARSSGQATRRMAAFFGPDQPLERLAIMHSGAEGPAKAFLDQILREQGRSLPRDILLVNVTPVIGLHVGPNALGFAAVGARLKSPDLVYLRQ
jgi:DegV family protein with EDD domain